ncbi:MAG: chemotaxis-specific protein-glutamate methyltransferase CheB [candidate division Zixibacteria bacterium]|nr:chemotaxis-specific protein-glutamate methyltransferase CheB [candidate division Zixibacteria bacterium]
MAHNNLIKVLIVDQSTAYRNHLIRAVGSIENTIIVGQASDYKMALDSIMLLSPDIVLLEYEMPGMGVKEAISEIKKRDENVEVILVSDYQKTSPVSSQKALELGAMYFIKKPKKKTPIEVIRYFTQYMKPVIKLCQVNRVSKKIRQSSSTIKTARKEFRQPDGKLNPFQYYDVVAIGSSLGGTTALKNVIPKLPANFPVPVVIVQHMPEKFTADFSVNLDAKSQITVTEIQGGEQLKPGHAYIAKGGKHAVLEKDKRIPGNSYRLQLVDGPSVCGVKPAVDVFLKSMAECVAGNMLVVILTGMGKDGLQGMKALKQTGRCHCITQDRESSVVYGMPGELAVAGLSDQILPLDSIAGKIVELVNRKKVPV